MSDRGQIASEYLVITAVVLIAVAVIFALSIIQYYDTVKLGKIAYAVD